MSKIIVFAFLAFAAATQALSHDVPAMFEHTLANTILKSSRSVSEDPQRSTNCFLEYLPKLNALTDDYEMEYNSCMDKTLNSKARVESEVLQDRNNVQALGNEICGGYANCSTISSSADFFDCYNTAASETITTSYTIQTTSKNKMQYITLRYQTIQYDQDVCTEKCKGVYVEETTKVYAALEVCLAGGYIPETSTTGTTYF